LITLYQDAPAHRRDRRPNIDECVLCKLCIEAAPPGTVHVKKLYDGTELS